MMNSIKKYKMPIIIVVVLIVVFIGYSYFKGDSSSTSDALVTSSNGTDAASGNGIGQDFINQLAILQHVSLDTTVFSDPRFQSLQDFSQTIPDEPQGRPNPFAPIGVDTVNNPTTVAPQSGAGFTFESSTSTGSQSSSTSNS